MQLIYDIGNFIYNDYELVVLYEYYFKSSFDSLTNKKHSKTNFLLILLVAEVDIEKKKIWWLFVKYEI